MEWMDWQITTAAQAESEKLFVASVGRQQGKTEIGVEIARRAANRGDRVLYLSAQLLCARTALRKLYSAQVDDRPESIKRYVQSPPWMSVELNHGGFVRFASYQSRIDLLGYDRIVADDFAVPVEWVLSRVHRETSVLLLPLGRHMPVGLDGLWFGIEHDADPTDETLWADAIPGLGTTMTLDGVRRMQQAMSADLFADEVLNRRAPSLAPV
ncbi:hypothetical protein [Rhodococcus sp. IEGM 1330]|uniref:hypothetical protein n=1 Tax=Rhodococcus sp. IEGM 1330 TaxID=3082225 RepID=UPI0029547B88|nr:hypothetical protein [Rhodococcus sp. IEGM 1330]MDV8022282.1 hypothetical protein [Rhodococcus sp. IEGM 1330]